MARRRAGTAIRKSWDARRIGRALAHQGADLRHWVSYATVAAVDDDGEVDLSNPNVIVISPNELDVDVVLEPSGYPMTCRYGQAAAGFFFCGPIKVGDQVVLSPMAKYAGLPHLRYSGKQGPIIEKRGRGYVVRVSDFKATKDIVVGAVHLKLAK